LRAGKYPGHQGFVPATNTAVRHLKSLLLIELLRGMWLTGRRRFGRKVAGQYPDEKTPQSGRFRGLHALHRYPNGEERCIACKLCEAACTAACIRIEAELAPDDARRTMRYDLDLFKCVYCGFCEEACPADAMVMTRLCEFHFLVRGGEVIHRKELLAIADRLEPPIAADRRSDAAFRQRIDDVLDW